MHARSAVLCMALLLGMAWATCGSAQAFLSPRLACGEGSCHARLTGSAFVLQLQDVEMNCRSAAGWGHLVSEASGTMRIGLYGCRELATPFKMSCVGTSGGAIKTNGMASALVEEGGIPNVLLSSAETSFNCGGGRVTQIEGYFIGGFDRNACGDAARGYGLHMSFMGHGHEGTSAGAANYDVNIDGRGGEEYDFETGWKLKFSRIVRLRC